MSTILKVENLSKQYRLGLVGSGTFKEDAAKWWAKIRGKQDPFRDFGEENDRTTIGGSNYVWSLKDINFEVQQGDVLGIVGRNGAGKSTLLKILSKVTAPTTGTIKAKGRIASLLEVGTGFHPELTGRENIYLNGAILGMRRQEIKVKLDEIIAFAGVERYIDTPVKRYSSGMYVRLAFAVAAHLENEILIIDEVLAVGDSEFQKKCLGKMGEVSKSEGRSVLFVSHNISAINELCNKGILLENGINTFSGSSKEVVDKYFLKPYELSSQFDLMNDSSLRRGNGEVRIIEVIINNNNHEIDPTKELKILFKIRVFSKIEELGLSFLIKGQNNEIISSTPFTIIDTNLDLVGAEFTYQILIKPNTFKTGIFPIYLWLGKRGDNKIENYHYDVLDSVFYLNFVSSLSKIDLGYDPVNPNGYLNLNCNITKITQ
jgi:lipopolysaccharide transport system ATP-binding protein